MSLACRHWRDLSSYWLAVLAFRGPLRAAATGLLAARQVDLQLGLWQEHKELPGGAPSFRVGHLRVKVSCASICNHTFCTTMLARCTASLVQCFHLSVSTCGGSQTGALGDDVVQRSGEADAPGN